MKIAVLGTGMVGRALAGRFAGLGHDVVVGTRDVKRTLTRTEPGAMGTPPYAEWQHTHSDVRLVPFREVGIHADLVVNATAGAVSLDALQAVGKENLAGKVLVDLAIPLDFSAGMPPRLIFANSDSLGEQIQRALPDTRVVKTLNTVFVEVMINPARVPGRHNVFIAGEDATAKNTAKGLLYDFGWPEESIIDLGGIQGARSTEMYMPLYFSLWRTLGTFDFNIAVARAE